MPNYSDYINAISQYGDSYNYGQGPVNPYSSAAYGGSSASARTYPTDPRSQFSDYKPSWESRLGGGAMGYGIGKGVGKAAPGIYSTFAKQVLGPDGKMIPGTMGANRAAGVGLGFQGAGLIYGATRDQNPYEYTPEESLGGVVSGAMAGASAGSMIAPGIGTFLGAILGGLGGHFLGESEEKKAEDLNIETEKQFQEDRTEYLEAVHGERKKAREQALGATEQDLWAQEASQYDNQYGAYANPYGQSLFDQGGKLTKKELKKVKQLGRSGDTELAHVNPQESAILKATGGSGTINPNTGLREYHFKGYNPFSQHNLAHASEPFVQAGEWAGGVIKDINEWSTGTTESDYSWTDSDNWFFEEGTGGFYGGGTPKFPWMYPLLGEEKPQEPEKIIKPRIERMTGSSATKLAPQQSKGMKVVSPFDVSSIGKKKGEGTSDLGKYRWDLANPYIEENVDIFAKGGSFTPPVTPVKAPITVSPAELFHYLTEQKGLSKNHALGMINNIQHESGFKFGAHNPDDLGKPASGLFQHRGSRRKNLIEFTGGKNKWSKDWRAQIDYMMTENDTKKYLKETFETPALASSWFTEHWERPKDADKKAVTRLETLPDIINSVSEPIVYPNLLEEIPITPTTQDEMQRTAFNQEMQQLRTDFPIDTASPMTTQVSMPPQYQTGGTVNTVAEFTGNELIVNNQNEVEAGLASNDFKRAADPIRQAMNQGYLTPGEETHQGNPMPVDSNGIIYAGGGKLPFRVNKGAGIYDHATDQFNSNMSDKEISIVAQKNINKWKSNNMV